MNPIERASHPSRNQILTLLDLFQRNPSLAKGFSRVPSARDATRKMWEKITLQLNSLEGCVKTSKQWIKYWADKKSAVKKKGALWLRRKNKTDGGAEVMELTDIEEKILTLLGGESFTIGDRHLEINPFEDTHASLDPNTDDSSPSLLTNQLFIGLDAAPPNTMTPQQSRLECVPGTLHLSTRPSVMSQSSMPRAQTVPSTLPRAGSPVSQMPIKPSGSGRHPQQATSSRRGRRRRPPPSQRQSHLSDLAERFLRVKEKRNEIQQQSLAILQSYLDNQIERDRSIVQAMQVIGDGLKLLAEVLKK